MTAARRRGLQMRCSSCFCAAVCSKENAALNPARSAPNFEWPRAKPPAGGAFQNGTAPRPFSSALLTKKLRPVLESTEPADAAGVFIILVTSPEIIFFSFEWAPSWRFSSRPLFNHFYALNWMCFSRKFPKQPWPQEQARSGRSRAKGFNEAGGKE
jgi:hypothetical protein